jgi:putative nucleotidyltransferase with HDIG domain
MSTTRASVRVDLARTTAEMLLDGLADRWAHTVGVAQRAQELAITVDPADRELLLAAAWLHDIGYSTALRTTGFHPLDGAAYLRQHGWPERICGLVAYHSGGLFIARAQNLDHMLDRYPNEQSPVSDALTYADQTVGPKGHPVSLDQRMTEMLARRGTNSLHAQVHHLREPHLRATAQRVQQRLSTPAT